MKHRQLGRTGVQVSVLGLGTNQFGRVVDEQGVRAIIDQAVELGVNFIDTAESYAGGVSEELLGKVLVGRRGDFVVATKTGAGNDLGRLTRKRILERLDASLRRLATDYIDVYYLHYSDSGTPLEESLSVLDDAVHSGKIRYAAVSNHAAWQVADAVGIAQRRAWGSVVASQMEYSLVERDVEREMLAACDHFGVSLVPYYPLAGGFLTGKYTRGAPPPPNTRFARSPQRPRYLSEENFDRLERWTAFARERSHSVGDLAVAWLLAHPVVCSVIAGSTSAEQVAANAKATEWELGPTEIGDL